MIGGHRKQGANGNLLVEVAGAVYQYFAHQFGIVQHQHRQRAHPDDGMDLLWSHFIHSILLYLWVVTATVRNVLEIFSFRQPW